MSSITSIGIAIVILVAICKKYYGINNKVKKNLESLEEIF